MHRLILFLALLLPLAACQQETPELGGDTPPTVAAPAPDNEAVCLEVGGRWSRGGRSPRPLCFLPNPDAGKSCSQASDCTGVCLSETRSCAPERPVFGCYGYLNAEGTAVMICVD